MVDKNKNDFSLITWVLLPIAVTINGASGWVVAKLDAPLYLDTIGTIFIAIVAGPVAGAITGIITNMGLGIVSPGYLPYWPVPLLIGLVAGFFANTGWFKRWWTVVIVGLIIALVAATASTLVAARVFGKTTFDLAYFLVEEPVDKIASALIAFAITQVLPKQIRALLPRSENIEAQKRAERK